MSFFKQYWNTVLEQAAEVGCTPGEVRIDPTCIQKDTGMVDSVEPVVEPVVIETKSQPQAGVMPEELKAWIDQVRGSVRPACTEETNTTTNQTDEEETVQTAKQSIRRGTPKTMDLNISMIYVNGVEVNVKSGPN